MIQSDKIDSELIEGSEGIQGDLHYSKSCDPVIKKVFFMRDNSYIRSHTHGIHYARLMISMNYTKKRPLCSNHAFNL